ncbi:PKD domain-containing protein [Tahibacter amnicola]|uniref:PKD domain-containing protein n=1 Tax=Tahibacter amnicola TaxID=2976241 RepID=A0ABY6BBH8_9GAMM|nr:PKD domain-containing protein [Tahibacter amnicola]UXI66500.1 PKD domain-containing protein [Tahibacter amnicola]
MHRLNGVIRRWGIGLAALVAVSHVAHGAQGADTAAIRAFDDWAQVYARATTTERSAESLAEGRRLAQSRRVALHALITTDPAQALQHAVPASVRAGLPATVQAELEQPIDGMGVLTHAIEMYHEHRADADGVEQPFHRAVRVPALVMGEERYLPFTYGRRKSLATLRALPVHGIAIDGDVAISEWPYRVLEADESVAAAQVADPARTCSEPAARQRIVTGNQVRTLCSAAELEQIVQQWGIAEQEARTGNADLRLGDVASSWTTGSKTFLYIRVRFSDQDASQLPDDATAAATMSGLRDFSRAFSYNAISDVVPTITPILVLPNTQQHYLDNGDGGILSDARAAAAAAGFNTANFNFYAVRFRDGPGSYGGKAYVGATGIWLKTNSAGVLAHEFGHNLGLFHANAYIAAGNDVVGPGTNSEYGNIFDRMGSGGALTAHFTASAKEKLTWLFNRQLVRVWGSGEYRFASHDVTTLSNTLGAAAFYPRERYWMMAADATEPVNGIAWFEHRTQFPAFDRAVHVNLQGTENWFVDMTPQSGGGVGDGALMLGRTYSDRMLGLHVTPVAKQDGTPATITLQVNNGEFAGNRAPTVSVVADTTTAATGATVTFTATAADADSDSLAYTWDWGDGTYGGINARTATKSWSSAGHYRVRVTASDMKGGTASAAVVVTVGTPPATALRASGRVTVGGVGVEGVHVWNGATGSNYRGAYTASDGTFQINKLASGSITFQASKKGMDMAAQFTNPVNLTADRTDVNFTATAHPVVSVTAVDTTAQPNGTDTLVFRVARTGATTNPLKVWFKRGGTAFTSGNPTNTSDDYKISTGTALFVDIPAGAASADIVATANSDTSPNEADESVIVDIADGIDYEVAYPGRAQGAITGVAGPANDAFVNRIALSGANVTTTGTNLYATMEYLEPPHNARLPGSGSVWWRWTAPSAGLARVSLAGTAFDSVVAVYTGTSLAQLVPVAMNNDAAAGVTTSQVDFPVTAGTTYVIAVANAAANATGGAINLAISLDTTGGDRIFANGFQ